MAHVSTDHPQTICPLSCVTRPAHAFPTIYPPPLRPQPEISPIEWLRVPGASPSVPSTPTIDIDSLCNQFMTSLVIGDKPGHTRQSKSSMFVPPAVSGMVSNPVQPCPQPPKRQHRRYEALHKLPAARSCTSPRKTTKPRQLSLPPFPTSPAKNGPAQRKASVPIPVPSTRHASGSQLPLQPNLHTAPPAPTSPNAPPYGDQNISSLPGLVTPLNPRSSSQPGRTSHAPQGWSYSPTGPTTPPTLLPDLFSEPAVASSSPVHLSPGSSLIPIADPFLQFQPQYDYFTDPCLISAFDCYGSIPELAPGNLFSKGGLNSSFGFDSLLWHSSTTALDPLKTSSVS